MRLTLSLAIALTLGYSGVPHTSLYFEDEATESSQPSGEEEEEEAAAEPENPPSWEGGVDLWANQPRAAFTAEANGGDDGHTSPTHSGHQDRYVRLDHHFCQIIDESSPMWAQYSQGSCPDGQVNTEYAIVTCPPDTYQLAPLFVMRANADGSYSNPEPVASGQCVSPADLAAEAERAFTTMHVPAPTATLQTANPTTLLVNAWYPAHTSNEPITHQAVLLDVPVQIRAIPTQFTWDFDDPFSQTGPTLTTTDPGRPWHEGEPVPDNHWVAHAWTQLGDPNTATGRAAGTKYDQDTGAKYRTDVTVTLTTTWHGQFRITGALTWTDIPGQLTTTATAGTYTVTEARTRLYCDDLTGHSTCNN